MPLPAPDPANFAKPKQWATFVHGRAQRFKMHSTVGQCKAALTSSHAFHHAMAGWIYRFDPDLDQWVEYAHVTSLDDPFWDAREVARVPKAIDTKREAEAIEAVREAMQRVTTKEKA